MISLRKYLLERHLNALEKSIKIVHAISISAFQPKISVCMPLHNCSASLSDSIMSLESSLSLPHEYIFILDSCTDNTKPILLDLLEKHNIFIENKTTNFLILESHIQLFETYCDYLGIMSSASEYVLEVQSDMFILHKNFDQLMLDQLKSDQKLAIIGGRGCLGIDSIQLYRQSLKCSIVNASNPFSLLKWFVIQAFPTIKKFYLKLFKNKSLHTPPVSISSKSETNDIDELSEFHNTGCAGRLSKDVATLDIHNSSSHLFYSDIVIRGPIMIKKKFVLSVGGFDIHNFFLGFDDIDLCIRLSKKNFRVAYIYINFFSPLELGASRRNKKFFALLCIVYNIYIRSKTPMNLSSKLPYIDGPRKTYHAKQLDQ